MGLQIRNTKHFLKKMENNRTLHLISQKGVEVRHPPIFMGMISDSHNWKSKKVYNKNWWYFYPLLLLAIIGYIIAQTLVLALIFVLAYFGEMLLGKGFMSSGGGVLLGLAGGMGMIVMHYVYVLVVFDNLPDRSRYKIKYY